MWPSYEEYERRVFRGLEEARKASPVEESQLEDVRLIVFSDHHRGSGDRADDFRNCRKIYHAALGYYLSSGHRLLLLGDVEELWERLLTGILHYYKPTLELEQKFFEAGRGVRFLGNHDEALEHPWNRSRLDRYTANSPLYESLLIHVKDGEERLGDLFFLHGHQGVNYTWFHRFVVKRLWAPVQKLTGFGFGTPSTDQSLRLTHERAMYGWAVERPEALLLVCGHTHHPIFMSTAWEETVREQLEQLREADAEPERIAMKEAELQWVMADMEEIRSLLPENARPCYFNTGCCSYREGDITGIEISDGNIRLVRWTGASGLPNRLVLRQAPLQSVFQKCVIPSPASAGA